MKEKRIELKLYIVERNGQLDITIGAENPDTCELREIYLSELKHRRASRSRMFWQPAPSQLDALLKKFVGFMDEQPEGTALKNLIARRAERLCKP
jgi:hypothetical protein